MSAVLEQTMIALFDEEEKTGERLVERAQRAGIPVQRRKDGDYFQCSDETLDYLRKASDPTEAPLLCTCLQRDFPHELEVHDRLGRDTIFDSRIKFSWPWSLLLV